MRGDKEYTLSELYMFLKLDIWRAGQVLHWGYVQKIEENNNEETFHFLKKHSVSANSSLLFKKQLSTGLYLLDSHLLKQDKETGESIHIIAIAVCQVTLANIKEIYYLKVVNNNNINNFNDIIVSEQAPVRQRKSILRRKSSQSVFTSSPINATSRKY